MFTLLLSQTFTNWDTSATYDQTWTVFLVLSCIAITRPVIGPALYYLSVFSKALAFPYWVMWLYMFIKQKPSLANAIITSNFMALINLVIFFVAIEFMMGGHFEINFDEFFMGLYSWVFYIMDDIHIMFIPVIMWILFSKRKSIPNADIVFVWMLGIILITPFILGFTDQIIHPYRFVPLIVFYGIGIGMVINYYIEKRNNGTIRERQDIHHHLDSKIKP